MAMTATFSRGYGVEDRVALLGVVERAAGAAVTVGDGAGAADGVHRASGEPGEARPVDQRAAVAVAGDRRAADHAGPVWHGQRLGFATPQQVPHEDASRHSI